MRARLAGFSIDTDLRPLVVAGPLEDAGPADALVRHAKDLISQGADAVLVSTDPHQGQVPALVGFTTARVEGGGVTGRVLCVGDVACPVLAVTDLDTGPEEGSEKTRVVDLGPETDRAVLAAQVASALEEGAVGFITVAPTPVRRAAYVIRAVESAR